MSKVVIFITGLKGGGAERFSVLLAGGLSSTGHDVTLLTGAKQDGEYNVDAAVHRDILVDEFFNGGLHSLERWSRSLEAYLNSHGTEICIAVCIAASIVACIASRHTSAKIIVCERNAPRQDALSWKSRALRFILYRRADFFVFQTSGAQSFYSKSIQTRSVIIPNPVLPNLPKWKPLGKNEIVAVGRLMPQKDYPLMLRAFALVHNTHPNWTLSIFGEGKYRDSYEALAHELGISDAVDFKGFELDVHERVAESDIFLMTSDFEGMPNALLEAMAMGMPCVSTDCPSGGPAMLIDDGVNGLLCSVGNEEEVANALLELIESSELRAVLGKRAYKARDDYSIAVIINKWSELISDLLRLNQAERL